MRRSRHVLLAWLASIALQLTLLGVQGVGTGAPACVTDSGTGPHSAWPAVSPAKRLLAPEPGDRRATTMPFVPAADVRIDAVAVVRPHASGEHRPLVPQSAGVTLPLARAPPALS